ncbi:MAG: DNA translocase FtsK, partial [Sphaerochaeta sp.]
MKKGTKTYILVGGIVLFILGLSLASAVASTQFGTPRPVVQKILGVLSIGFGFSASDSPLGLLPLAGMLFVWSGMFFSFRNKRAFSFVFVPLSAIMFYTLLVFSHMLQHSGRPQFLQSLLYSFN